jgi:hypothetical protein
MPLQRAPCYYSPMVTGKKPSRKAVPPANETAVLTKSARRCLLCFHLDGILTEKAGQIAHLDQDPSNGSEDNLAWMCMPHHSQYDSKTSQHKNYTLPEVKVLRSKIYEAIARGEHREKPLEGRGGKGGDAKVGGSGIATGGPGGQAGKYGIGGTGGSAEVHGDGLAAGGAGGAAGDDGIWRAPAKSGYEITQRRLGLPVDSYMRQFGRGGAGGGYEPKLAIIEQFRASYFATHSKKPQTIFEHINAVPLDYLNSELLVNNEIWRVRIVDDEYEFFIPTTGS